MTPECSYCGLVKNDFMIAHATGRGHIHRSCLESRKDGLRLAASHPLNTKAQRKAAQRALDDIDKWWP